MKDLIEFTKMFLSADKEAQDMALYCLKNPDRVTPIIKQYGDNAEELRKKLREVME